MPWVSDADASRRDRVVRDPVHGYIDVPGELAPLVASSAVQRLRYIAQTARAVVRYPSLTGTRFEHALGTMHLAVRGWTSAWVNCSTAPGEDRDAVRAAFARDVVEDLSTAPDPDPVTTGWLAAVRAGGADGTQAFVHGIGLAVAAVGLLHDVGHPPFSHILEPFFHARIRQIFGPAADDAFRAYSASSRHGAQFHEWAGLAIVDGLPDAAFVHLPRTLVRRLLADRSGDGWTGCLHGIVDGQFDVDRLDYLMRDADRAGTEFGSIDHERLLSSLELHRSPSRQWAIGLGARAISAFETLLVQRAQLYRWVNHHHAVVAADTALRRCVAEAYDLSTCDLPDPSASTYRPLRALSEALPDLDYITAATAGDARTLADACSDDLACFAWLRRCVPHLARLADQEEDPALALRARITIALHGLCDTFAVTAVPAWRNYQEFLARAEQSPDAVHTLLDRVSRPPVPDHLMTTASREAFAALLGEVGAQLNAALDAQLTGTPGGTEDIAAVERRLTAAVPSVDAVGAGFWLLARLPFLAVKEEFATVWRGDEESALSTVSPFPLALTAIEAMRPRWMAYFVPFASVADETDKHARREVGRALLGELARWP